MAEAKPDATVEVVRAPLFAGLAHGFLGRRGGVSLGDVAGLNVGLGSGDAGTALGRRWRLVRSRARY